MPTPRRRLLRTTPEAVAIDPRQSKLLQKRRGRLVKERLGLDRWMKRLTRACRAVEKQSQRISRLERQIRQADQA